MDGNHPDVSTLQVYLVALGVASVIVYVMYHYDKQQAIAGEWRVKESTLLLGTIASPVGGFLGMVVPWHKVRKPTFWTVLCISTGLHLFVLWNILQNNVKVSNYL